MLAVSAVSAAVFYAAGMRGKTGAATSVPAFVSHSDQLKVDLTCVADSQGSVGRLQSLSEMPLYRPQRGLERLNCETT